MRLGLHISEFTVSGGTPGLAAELGRVGEAAEAAGTSWVSVMDHFFQMDWRSPAEDPMLESYATLAYLAAHTSTVRLGTLVTGVTYRHPGVLAKIVSTVDVLSGGRAALGIGAAWYEREHTGLGVPFPPLAERFTRLEETLHICRQMWDPADNGPFTGEHYRLDETICQPQPLSSPRPPILIGGGGERKTLRLVARYADACNLFATSPGDVRRKLDVLRTHCDTAGRDYDEITKTILYQGDALRRGAHDEFVAEMAGYAGLGVDTAIVLPPGDAPARWIDRECAPVVPRLASL